VNIVTANLFRKYRGPQDFIDVSQEELEKDIHSTGFFRNKAKNIKAASQRLVEVYGGEIPRTMEEILTLGGVARKTANVVLGNAFGIASGVVVDTHVSRLSQRLGLTEQTTPEKIERDLEQLVPKKTLDNVPALDDLSRPPSLYRAKTQMPRVRSRRHLPEPPAFLPGISP
jgi:endonuclease III